MDIEKYRTFITAADCSSFASAAEKLFLTTPTVTKHISAIEREMGVSLFERRAQGVRLSSEGEKRVELARQIVAAYDALNKMNAGKTLEVFSIPCLEKIGVPGILRGFAMARPEIGVQLTERHGCALMDDLLNRRCEIAFLGNVYARTDGLDSVEIFNEKVCLAMSSEHPLASNGRVSLKELCSENFIMMLPETGMPAYYEKCCLSCGFKPKVSAFCSREDSLLSYVASGMGVAFFTFGKMPRREIPGVTFVEIEEDFFSGCILAKPTGAKLSPSASAFWKYVSSTAKSE